MSRREGVQSVATLKQISYRISSTPTAQLPRLVPQIASSIWSCRSLLSSTVPTTKQASEDGVAVHRFKTQLSTLLQDRTVEGRWSAVVLAKATIEAGGLEVLSKAGPWVKHLLVILKKPDPPSTRTLATITLTRIFMLTWDHANLIREMTTPNLQAFISANFNNVESKRCSSNELQAALEAFATLIPRHPTTFRTHEGQIRGLLNRIISSNATTPAGVHYTESHIAAAEKLLVLLHHCAPKQGGAEKWDNTFKAVVSAAHATSDRVLRSVIEDWRSTTNVQPSVPAQQLLAGEVELEGEDSASMTGWKGVYAGTERLIALVDTLTAHLQCATAGTTTLRLGVIADLITRLLSVTVPMPGRQDFVKPNQQVPKDEREVLYSLLPRIHSTVFSLIESIIDRFGSAVISTVANLLSQVTWAFRAEKTDETFRIAAYHVLRKALALVGPPMVKDQVADFAPYVTACCADLMLEMPAATAQTTTQNASSSSSNRTESDVQSAASALLPVFLYNINPKDLPRKLRAQVDRTAILTKHKDALVASVLNPPLNASGTGSEASVLPFLARLFPGDAEVEALVRPRMPVTLTGRKNNNPAAEDDSEEEDSEDEGSVDAMDVTNPDVAGGTHDADDATTAAEPDLLTALDEHLGSTDPKLHAAEEDLYSASPPKQSKRLAPVTSESEIPAKRFRAEPVAETLAPRLGWDLPGPNPATVASGAPKTVVGGGLSATVTAASGATGGDGESDDGSDFEMPPLTMEPDTEDEEEEEEDEEDE